VWSCVDEVAENAVTRRDRGIRHETPPCEQPEDCDRSKGCIRHYTDTRPTATAASSYPEGGLPHGEHPHDYGYYCCLCFKSLTPEECNVREDGTKEDVCVECAEMKKLDMKESKKLFGKRGRLAQFGHRHERAKRIMWKLGLIPNVIGPFYE
jgi:hypothetical protein